MSDQNIPAAYSRVRDQHNTMIGTFINCSQMITMNDSRMHCCTSLLPLLEEQVRNIEHSLQSHS